MEKLEEKKKGKYVIEKKRKEGKVRPTMIPEF